MLVAMVAPMFAYILLQIYQLSKTLARLQAEEDAKAAKEEEENKDTDTEKKKKKGKSNLLKYIAMAAILAGVVYFVAFQEEYSIKTTMTSAVDWIRDQGKHCASETLRMSLNLTVLDEGSMGPVYYTIFLAIWVTLLLPCTILEVVPGYLFGLKIGTVVSIIGKSSGSFVR